jgi:UDP-N-acetylglucosamine--N-acetylmuramyl-(pentapeptide) pyrophosphoryl-undecaprenol N-acetylglucosamine transferase
MKKYYVYVAGRSGGHIVPALTLIQQLSSDCHAMIITTTTPLDKHIVHDFSAKNSAACFFEYTSINLPNVPRSPIKKVGWLLMVCYAMFKVMCWFIQKRPEQVISMGGYVSIPVVVAAWLLRIPVMVYELNVVPGRATLFLTRFAKQISICFEYSKKYFASKYQFNIKLVRYPIRFTSVLSKPEAKKLLGFDDQVSVLLICGGSQGSAFFNNLSEVLARYYQQAGINPFVVIHQTGVTDVDTVRTIYVSAGIKALVFAYRSDVDICYAAADYAITRAGAGSLFELLFFKVPALIVPLQTATTKHQVDNAKAFVQEYGSEFALLMQDEIIRDEHRFLMWISKGLAGR